MSSANNSGDQRASRPELRPVGTRAWLVDLPDLDTVMTWHAHLSEHPLPGQEEAIAAARTVLVLFATRKHTIQAKPLLESLAPQSLQSTDSRTVSIDVIYDGEDLEQVASLLGISATELVERHTQQEWKAAFGGFAPGFTYCVPAGDDFSWDIPRLEKPRTAVPSGAVGLAGNFSAVYPRTSPGGWQLIGHTETKMWNTTANPPALLQPGDSVSYHAVRENIELRDTPAASAEVSSTASTPASASESTSTPLAPARPAFTVDNPGMQTLLEDTGRGGYGDMGVNRSGAADRTSAWVANDVVGNAGNAAVLENIGGLTLHATTDVVVCATGAEATLKVQDQTHPLAIPVLVRAGQSISLTPANAPHTGLRHYLAARGGFVASTVLESASTDVLSGLGPAPVQKADVLKIGHRAAPRAIGEPATNPLRSSRELRCIPGPRDNWFNSEEFSKFCTRDWIVSGQSNRVGLRLELPRGDRGGVEKEDAENKGLQRSHEGELASEGMVSGCVQVPPNGLPVVFLADHPVTGGYPVIATVISEDLDIAGQLAPGETVRFVPVDPDTLAPTDTATDPSAENSTTAENTAPAGEKS